MVKNKSPLLPIICTLTIVGLIYLSASLPEAEFTLNDQFYFLKRQSLWVFLSAITFWLAVKTKITFLSKISLYLYLASTILLVLPFLPPIGRISLGAKRWLDLGFFSLQPTEIFKLTSIIFFSSLLSRPSPKQVRTLFYLIPPLFLVISEPNLSTAVIIFATIISLYYLAGGNIFHLAGLLFATILLTFALTLASPYRASRFQTLIQTRSASPPNSYHQKQIALALGSGGLLGKGLGQSDQKFQFLPKIATDSIFAIIGEELGLAGVLTIISLYLTLITHLFRFSQKLSDPFSSLLTAGVACWIGYQSLTHLAATAALIPLTGVPLPFISYGGSALICLSFATGLIYNVQKDHDKQGHSPRRHPSHSRH